MNATIAYIDEVGHITAESIQKMRAKWLKKEGEAKKINKFTILYDNEIETKVDNCTYVTRYKDDKLISESTYITTSPKKWVF